MRGAAVDGGEVPLGDCEQWHGAFPGQPVNSLSSLAYVAVALVIARLVQRGRLSGWFLPFAAVLALECVGSILFHGRSGDVAQLLHDAPLGGMVGFIAGWHVGRMDSRRSASALGRSAAVGMAVGLVGGGFAAAGGWSNVLVVVGVIVVIGAEVMARHRGGSAIWGPGLLATLALAGVTWWVGSSDGPLCDPQSWAQPHGAWHILSALVALGWVDCAASAIDPRRAPRIGRSAVDRAFAWIALGLTYAFYRSIDVEGRERIPRDAPLLVVANHGNGFVDPVLVAAALGRLPRFIAKAGLWKFVVARPLLALAGVLPVHRRADGDEVSSNRSVFAACHEELARRGVVAIFPEGTTGDRAGLDRVRSGASRIALGSLADAPDLRLLPVGLAFESRTETRGRALVVFGDPVVADTVGAAQGGEPRPADVRALTAAITDALERVSPEFASIEERGILRASARAQMWLDAPGRSPGFGAVETLARALATATPDQRAEIVDAYRRYATELQLIGLHDQELQPAPTSWRRILGAVVVAVALGSVVVTAVLIHLPALLLVWAATAAVRSTATKGTVRLLVGLAAGLATWITVGLVVADGWASVLAGALVAAEGALALAVVSPLTDVVGQLWGRLRTRDRVGLLGPAESARDQLSAAVVAAREAASPSF